MAQVRHLGLFPFCAPFPYWDEQGTRDIAVPMWWQVKRWLLDVVVNYGGSSRSESFELDVSEQTVEPLPVVESEKNLVCLDSDHIWSVAPQELFNSNVNLTVGPRFELVIESDGETTTHSTLFADQIGTEVVSGSVTIVMGELQVAEPLYRAANGSGSATATLTAIEYWPYA